YLLRLLMTAPNVLLLDEPTNDLDIPTLVALEDYLDSFPGSVIAVSHDRYFLDRVVERVLRFEGDGHVREYPGNYSAFLEIRAREASEQERDAVQPLKTAPKTAAEADKTKARKLSFKEKKELESLENKIADGDKRKQDIETALSSAGADYELTTKL